jgi:hypothetical protein
MGTVGRPEYSYFNKEVLAMRKSRVSQTLAAMVLAVIVLTALTTGFTALAAETHVVVSIYNTESTAAVNPFIRVFTQKKLFATGGPFTVRMEMKIEGFRRMDTEHVPSAFVNMNNEKTFLDSSQMSQWTVSANTNGWEDIKRPNGNYITFSNVNPGAIIDGTMQPYYLINFGLFYAKANMFIRNFRILNAAGVVVYSWDTDNDFTKLFTYAVEHGASEVSLKDIGLVEPEPTTLTAQFLGGSAKVLLTREESSVTPTPSTSSAASQTGPAYEDESVPATAVSKPSSVSSTPTGTTVSNVSGNADYEDESALFEDDSAPEDEISETPDDFNSDESSTESDASGSTLVQENSGGLGGGMIALIVIGVLMVLAGGALAILVFTGHSPFKKKETDQEK